MSYIRHFKPDSVFLVTGGAGFIGSNIVEKLLENDFTVRVVDNFSTGKRSNIEPFLSNSSFTLIEGDIRDEKTCMESCEGVDYILHQGALGSVPRSIEDPLTSHNVNSTGTLNMLWAAHKKNVRKFVYASSSSVYGDNPDLPKVEEKTGMLLSPYAATKMTNEHYASLFHQLYGLETVGLRYFNVFGKHQDPHSVYAAVIPIFLKKLLNGESPVIHGNGEQSRDFTYIENVIEANLKSALSPSNVSGMAFNISLGDRITLNKLYQVLTESLGVTIKATYGPPRPGDIMHSQADISKARKYLQYDPQYSFSKGIELTIDWYRENLRGK
ncbi:MAG: SDR family oxidoreductase [Deltaproteobacteria bacterium]|nr:SDR family oxidoreductase [Deltaproteobacteria bacterium]